MEEGTRHPGSRPGGSQKAKAGACPRLATISPSVGHGEPAAACGLLALMGSSWDCKNTAPKSGLIHPWMENDVVRRQADREPERDES